MGSVEIAVTIVLTGVLVVLPVVVLAFRHHQKMTELLNRNRGELSEGLEQKLDAIQRELAEIKDRQNELILERHQELPPTAPRVEDRITD